MIKKYRQQKRRVSLILLAIIFLGVIYLGLKEYSQKLERADYLNKYTIPDDSAPKSGSEVYITQDPSKRFTYTIPYTSLGDYRDTIETWALGFHGHNIDPKYRFLEDSLIVAGDVQHPVNLALKEEFTISAVYDPTYAKHINLSKLRFLYTPLRQGNNPSEWSELESSVDLESSIVTTTFDKFGNFALVGPLICPEDTSEPDDNYDGSILIEESKYGQNIPMVFDIQNDENWIRFLATKGNSYNFDTPNKTEGVNPILEVYDNSGTHMLISGIDNLTLNPDQNLFSQSDVVNYFLRVKSGNGGNIGCEAKFDIIITKSTQ